MNKEQYAVFDRMFQVMRYNQENLSELCGAFGDEQNILELAFGFGNLVKKLLDAGKKVCGVEISPDCVEYVSEKLPDYEDRLDLRLMDARDLQFPDESFDGVVCNSSMGDIGEIEKVCKGVHKVLKKNGLFVFTTFGIAANMFMADDLMSAVALGKLPTYWKDLEYMKANPPEFADAVPHSIIFQALEGAGFGKSESKPYYFGACEIHKVRK